MSSSKEYSNGEITIVWKPDLCVHSAVCVRGLPAVFNPNERPWIKIDQAETKDLANVVEKCPSGALTYFMNNEKKESTSESVESKNSITVKIMKGGPLIITSPITVTHPDGSTEEREKASAFCRCGQTKKGPYCDGTHKSLSNFE